MDGNTLLIGAYQDSDVANGAGSAYVFVKDGSGGWIQLAKLTVADAAAGDFLVLLLLSVVTPP